MAIDQDDGREAEDERLGDAMERYLDQKAAEIAEHFDTVQIVATKHDGSDGATFWITKGRGDSYARYGALKRAVLTDERRFKKT
jgi:hypothetical protein